MAYVRVQGNTVVEILQPVNGFSVEQCFHPDLLNQCELIHTEIQVGWVRQEDGTFADPNAPVVEEPVVEETPEEPAP